MTATPDTLAAETPELAARVAATVEESGYAVVTGVLSPERCAELAGEVDRVETEHRIGVGKSDFEGFHTKRIFNLIARGPRFRDLVIHQKVLPVIGAILGDGFLLSGTTSMHISPGETSQLLHADDGMISLPRPHVATMVTSMWALTDFSAENGATRIVPGSHRNEAMPRPGEKHEAVDAEMPAASALILHGSVWHGGGSNTTADVERYGLSIQYVAGWCRQQQNLMLGTDRDLVASYPRRLQELIGYSMYRYVMGHVDREHPLTLLGVDQPPEMIWERMDDKRPEPAE